MQKFFQIILVSAGTAVATGPLAISMAQTSSAEPEDPEWGPLAQTLSDIRGDHWDLRLNAPGSIFHGRTAELVNQLLFAINEMNRYSAEQAGNPIPEELTRFNQVTNLSQLAPVETVWLPYNEDNPPLAYYFIDLETLRAGDLAGLVNLKALGFIKLRTIEAGAFEGLPNLEILHLHFSSIRTASTSKRITLPEGLFDPLANSLKELRVGYNLNVPRNSRQVRDSFALPSGALDRLINLEKLGISVTHEKRYDHLVNLKEIDFSVYFTLRSASTNERASPTITLPPLVRTIGGDRSRTFYEISPSPVNVGGGYVFPGVSPSPPPTEAVGQRSSDLSFTSTALSLSEGESATYQVRATASRAGDMVVNLATAHSGITVNPSRLTFASHNWQTFQTVTVTASADAAPTTNEQASIMHSIPASPGFIANNNAGIVSVTLAHTVVEEEVEEEEVDRQNIQEVKVDPTDYDQNDDGLIEISNLAQLNAIRWDLNGDGQPDKGEFANDYALAFPGAIENMGSPADVQVHGYELTGDLDFGDNPTSWESIGIFSKPFQAVFEGNNHVIFNLFQDQSDPAVFINKPSGLFGSIGHRGQVVNLGLEGVNIHGINWVGALVGLHQGNILACSATGRVEGENGVGGLVGQNFGDIVLSAADVEVNGVSGVGDLMGIDTTAR